MSTQIGTADVNQAGHLLVGGVDAVKLATEYQTPLIAYDVSKIRQQIHHFKAIFDSAQVKYQISYASKAFATIAMYQLINQEQIHCDVVSGGELYTAVKAGFPIDKVSFHGNNKSREELQFALEHQIGCIIIDNFHEIELLRELTEKSQQSVDVMLRVTPGVSAHTHEYDMTGQEDSKFGFDIKSGQADQAIQQIIATPYLNPVGIHCHIGSQIFAIEGFILAAQKMMQLVLDWKNKFNFETPIVNLGGGFGIRYTDDEQPLQPEVFIQAIIDEIKKIATKNNLKLPEIWIEPGRSIVGAAGVSLYTVGSHKSIPGVRNYLAVDGGMGDNIRPALYQAKYESVVANKMNEPTAQTVSIAGKYCESGDMLAWDQKLPATQAGDIVAMLDTGAYGYSMASNYNRNPRPAVVFCENGKSQLVVKREQWQDMTALDLPLIES
ncbi:diaminopimelate decarboxylase [Paucilactobacillus wasatchensis]|uniref:Diaminopimelate decarboxylase n=1 Tax=Paucilactobacillus wasatchensis TaxID=1335616 RepID=A0A0D0YXQ8_9LACO|nr:diaminopimelate decarboxylase [Paucilactobacillus wasatchensis]KIS03999.1 Diaminopimelate decarboxylase [Paucilactobacillus wasatchensis]